MIPHFLFAEIFVANAAGSSIVVFDNNANGDVAPIRTISGDNTQLAYPTDIYVYNGELYVSDLDNNTVAVFLENDDGDVAPQRVLNVPNPEAITIDSGELFVASDDSIRVFDISDTQDTEPKRVIYGNSTLLDVPGGIDVQNGELFVANIFGDSITIYPSNADGDVAPIRIIAGESTGLYFPCGMSVTDDEIVAFGADDIRIFPINATGDVTPTRTIGGDNTTLTGGEISGIAANGLIYVSQYTNGTIPIFNIDDSGDAVPTRIIEGSSTTLIEPYHLFVTPDTPASNAALPAILYLLF